MLYGKVLRPPTYGATLKDVDLSAGKAPGVTWCATAIWSAWPRPTCWPPKGPSTPSSPDGHLGHRSPASEHGHLRLSARRTPAVRRRTRSRTGLASAAKSLRATYHVAYVAHAPLEPRAGLAEWNGGKLTRLDSARRTPSAAAASSPAPSGCATTHVRVIVPDFGGGFGGKHTGEAALEAARLAAGRRHARAGCAGRARRSSPGPTSARPP